MSLYPPELGRQTVAQYMHFRDGVDERNTLAASDAIQAMGEHFPDIDARSRLLRMVARGIVKQLALNGHFDKALDTTESFFSAYTISNDSRIAERHADCYRYIAKYSNQQSMAQLALKFYNKALQQPKSFKESIHAKQQQCRQITA